MRKKARETALQTPRSEEEVLHGGAEIPLQSLEETTLDQALLTGTAARGGPMLEQGNSMRRKERQRGAVMD